MGKRNPAHPAQSVGVALSVALMVVMLAIGSVTHVYMGDALGLAWNWGGVELSPSGESVGVFICEGEYNGNVVEHNPLAVLFPELVADC